MGKRRRNELILVGLIVLLAAGFFIYKKVAPAKKGSEVVVSVFGREYARFPLNENREFPISYLNNLNLLVIEDGYAYIKEASCPDGLCVHQGKINKSGEIIVCLPNEVVITVEGPEDSGVDSVVK
ncbi:MAG: NusG domain II-containing protein [Lachnospiraceae bacterium]|nr:NusG domain II-containing protein [Lachnospiraceae bacterium]